MAIFCADPLEDGNNEKLSRVLTIQRVTHTLNTDRSVYHDL